MQLKKNITRKENKQWYLVAAQDLTLVNWLRQKHVYIYTILKKKIKIKHKPNIILVYY